MISVILSILKILGMVLLVLLGILILVICLVLFVPIKIRMDGSYQCSKATISSRVTWLLHFISAKILMEYDNAFSLHIVVRLLGIPVYDNQKKASSKKNFKRKPKKRKESDYNPDGPPPEGTEIQAASTDSNDEEYYYNSLDSEDFKAESFNKEEFSNNNLDNKDFNNMESWQNTYPEESENDKTDNKNLFEKLYILFGKLIQFIENIKYTFHKLYDTMLKIRDNINNYLDLLQKESTLHAIDTCKIQLMRVIKSLSPQKFQVNLHLGNEDPAVLGEILAIWGMFYPFHQGRIDIVPEFGQTILEGDILLKGKISLFIYLKAALILFFDKNIKQLVKQLKQSI